MRYQITSQTVNADQTMTVAYTLTCVDDTSGATTWTDNRTRVYSASVTTDKVLSDIQQDAVDAQCLIEASSGLVPSTGHTYELQNGTWVQVS